MTINPKEEWLKIEAEIYSAPKSVTLDGGIGYYEAGALHDWLKPTDKEYIEENNKDQRKDWTKCLSLLKIEI